MSDVRRSGRADALRADIAASRRRIEIDAEAVAYRTDVRARATDALEDGKDKLIATLARTFDTAREALANSATTTQSSAEEFVDRARPHVGAAVESAKATARRAGAHVSEVAGDAADRLAPLSDALAAGREALAHRDEPPAIEATGA